MLKKYGVEERSISDDGNCFYYSLLDQLLNNKIGYFRDESGKTKELDAKALRSIAVNHIRNNKDEYKDFIDCDFEDYLESHLKDKVQADEIIQIALSRELGVNIVTINSNHQGNDNLVITKQGDNKPNLYLHRIERKDGAGHLSGHYNSLMPIENNQKFKELQSQILSEPLDKKANEPSKINLIHQIDIVEEVDKKKIQTQIEEDRKFAEKLSISYDIEDNRDKLSHSDVESRKIIDKLAKLANHELDPEIKKLLVEDFRRNLQNPQNNPETLVNELSKYFSVPKTLGAGRGGVGGSNSK